MLRTIFIGQTDRGSVPAVISRWIIRLIDRSQSTRIKLPNPASSVSAIMRHGFLMARARAGDKTRKLLKNFNLLSIRIKTLSHAPAGHTF